MNTSDDSDFTEEIITPDGGDSLSDPWTPSDPTPDWIEQIVEK